MQSGFIEILNALHDRRVEFVIVGGVAAVLHGGSRVTFDLDVVPSLTPDSWEAAVDLLWGLGARPRIPSTRRTAARRSICWSGKATLSTSSSSEQSR